MSNYKGFSSVLTILLIVTFLAGISYPMHSDDDLKIIHNRTFKTEPGKKLKISGSPGDILVTAWDKSEVQVVIFGNEKAKEKVQFTFNDNTEIIEVTAKREGFFLNSSGIHIRFEIKVPRKFHNNLSTSGGDIRFAGIEGDNILTTSGGDVAVKDAKGKLQVTTSGGDISFEKSYGNLELSTSGGDINGKEFSGDVELSTSGGDIKLQGNNSRISAETSGGDIELNYDGENKGIELATSGGNISIRVPAGFNASALLNTSGGDVECRVKTNNIRKLSSSKFEGDLNAGGNKLVAKTSGGTIEVNPK